ESGALYADLRRTALAAQQPVTGTTFAFESVSEGVEVFAEWRWWFDGPLPELHSAFSLSLPPGQVATFRPGSGARPTLERSGNAWTWTLDDQPARRPESLAPEPGDIGACLFVTTRDTLGAPPLPANGPARFRSWGEVASWLDALETPQCVVTPEIAARAGALTAGAPDTLARLAALARDVQRTNYVQVTLGLERGAGYRPHPAAQVMAAGYGDCKDKANLFCALARAAGLEAFMVSVEAENRDHVVPDWPSPSQFDHCIVLVRVPPGTRRPAVFRHPSLGPVMAFDPTDPCTAFGDLPRDEQGSWALVSAASGGTLVRLPVASPESARMSRAMDATLSAQGALEAHVEERSIGQSAASERAAHRQSATEYRNGLEQWLAGDGASVELTRYDAAEDSVTGEFRLELDFRAPLFARIAGGRLMTFRPALLSPRVENALVDSARTSPLSLEASCFSESVSVHLPEGWRVDDPPATIDRNTGFGRMHAEWRVSPGLLTFVRAVRVETTTLPATRYAEVRDFFAAERQATNEPVVLIAD
ncbi:MAG TPA: transglutaminase domain-containing protein, partial [Polyangiaceae bacterium]|nr:transglutaminase domain-containing protein [Polyangiaceae bacterium]